jgi:hypothetical protein
VVAGDSRFAGLGEAGRFTDSMAAAASGSALWLVLVDGSGVGRLVQVTEPNDEAIAEFEQASASGESDGAPPSLTLTDAGEVGTNAVITSLGGGSVAVADPGSGRISFWQTDALGAPVNTGSFVVDGLQGATLVLPVNGGALASFVVSTGTGWRLVAAGANGQVRSTDLASTSGVNIARPVIVGSTLFTANRADASVIAVNVDTGAAVEVYEQGRYPLDPELDVPSAVSAGLSSVDFDAVELERHGARVSVNVPGGAQALLLDADGGLVEILEKGRAKPIDPNAEVDPNVRGDAEPPPEQQEDDPEETPVGTTPANLEREGDASLACDPSVDQTPRPPLLLPQSGERAARSITARWRYELVSATDCLPSFRIELRRLPNGNADLRDLARPNATTATLSDLTPATEYEVTVIAYIGDETARSNTALFRTGEQGPEDPTNLRFTDNGGRWTLEWDGCTTTTGCDVPASQFAVEWSDGGQFGSGETEVPAAAARRVTVEITNDNVGRNLCFTVTALSANNTSSSPSQPLCGVRERAPFGAGQFVQVRSQKVPGRAVQDVTVTIDGLNSDNFPVVMGTRGTVDVLVQIFGTGQGQFDAGIPGTLQFGQGLRPITVEGVPFGSGSYGYRVTFANSAGSEEVTGEVILDPISCGRATVTVTGQNSFNNRGGSWPIVFTAANPCPGNLPPPELTVVAPPGCSAYPAPLSIGCTTASRSLQAGFGYQVLVTDPPGFIIEGVNFVSGDGIDFLTEPSGASYRSAFTLTSIAVNGTSYDMTFLSERGFGAPNLTSLATSCQSTGASGSSFSFRCSATDDRTNSNVPLDVRMVPAPSSPRGPYPPLQGTCASRTNPPPRPPGAQINTSFDMANCTIRLAKIALPDPPTTPPPPTSCRPEWEGKTFTQLGVSAPPPPTGVDADGDSWPNNNSLYCDWLGGTIPMPTPP